MNIAVGKYTLESLTSGMYNSPMVLYREYVQNAIDAIDDAVDAGILQGNEPHVTIQIDPDQQRLIIEDNGTGTPSEHIEAQLLGIGNSNKALLKRRGFRGIGRLVGIGYADQLAFYTSYAGETVGNRITINCRKLRQILIPGQYENYGMVDALEEVIDREEYLEGQDSHYFRVELDGISSVKQLLNYELVNDYLCQTAPLPYDPRCFSWGNEIEQAFINIGQALSHYRIFLKRPDEDPQQLFKLYSDRFFVNMSKQQIDRIEKVHFKPLIDENDDTLAMLWYAESRYLGTILDDKIKGLRFRRGNILVGDRSTANPLFKEERFNGWFQGEILVVDPRIIPNARRDDFEQNEHYDRLLSNLSTVGSELSRVIRQVSSQRNKEPDVYEKIRILSNQSPVAVTKYPQINLCSNLNQSEKKLLEKVFETLDENSSKKSSILKQTILDKLQGK